MKKTVVITILACIFLTSCSLSSVDKPIEKPVAAEDFIMGTLVTQSVYGVNAQKAIDEVRKRLKEIEDKMTINAPGGEVNKLNGAAGKNPVKLSSDTLKVLETAKHFSALSGEAFDVTIGPLVKAWGIFTDHPRIPPQDEIDRLYKLTGNDNLILDLKNSSAMLKKPGQIVDVGGIAKGYAGDEAIRIYKENNIKSAYVNLGGNVVVLGEKPNGNKWKIGIQNPRAVNGVLLGIVEVSDKAIVTSGDYERYFEKDNIRYHHILDPKTGYPSDSGLISSTIVADVSIDADALSTSVFILGLEKGVKLVESLDGVEAIFITAAKKIYVTPGLKNSFKFDDESKEFSYVEKG